MEEENTMQISYLEVIREYRATKRINYLKKENKNQVSYRWGKRNGEIRDKNKETIKFQIKICNSIYCIEWINNRTMHCFTSREYIYI